MPSDTGSPSDGGVNAFGWRWRNFPVPEAHVAGLLLGVGLHLLRPWHLAAERRTRRSLGSSLIVAGAVVVAWAVRAVGEVDVAEPARLVTIGPYARSRNPMYVGWTAVYLGVSLLIASVWPLVLLPAVAVASHRVVRREERELERAFGEEYRAYARSVRQYL